MKNFKFILLVFLAIFTLFSFTSCDYTKENVIQHNLLRETGNFNTYRKITVINLRSDKVLMEFEGYLTSKLDNERDVNIMIMIGPNEFQLHYVRLADEITYICEQLENTSTDPYHWRVNIYAVWPDIIVG